MSTSKTTWTNFERDIATGITEATGETCKRNPLSGANNRSDSGDPRPGDIVFHPNLGFSVLAEAKYRASHAHHKLFREAQSDAAKHKLEHTILFTKQKGEKGHLVVLDAELFYSLLAIPEVREKLRPSSTSQQNNSVASKPKPKPPKQSPTK